MPFRVQVFDEDSTIIQDKLYRELLRDDPDLELDPPQPIFHEVYRPEFQFSVYNLDVAAFNRGEIDDDGNEQLIDVYPAENPTIGSTDDFIEALYSLIGSEFDRLPGFGANPELVFAFGEEEQSALLGDDQSLRFTNVAHLSALEAVDFMSMRLYSNHDSANVLWEYAFWLLDLSIADDGDLIVGDDIVYVSADEPQIDLAAALIGYVLLDDDQLMNAPERIKWIVKSGDASVDPVIAEIDEAGTALTTVTLAPNRDNVVQIEAVVVGEEETSAVSFDIGLVSGRPANMSLSQSGTAYIKGRGEVTVSATVTDQHGNRVENGTGVLFRETGHANLVAYTGFTDDGVVTGRLTGGSVGGTYPLNVSSGDAQGSVGITVLPLDVEIVGIPAAMITGNEYDLIARVTGTSDPLDRIFVDLCATAGTIMNRDPYTDSSGEIAFTYKAPRQAGVHTLAAKVDLEQPVETLVTVNAPAVQAPVRAERHYVLSGTGGDVQSPIADYRGNAGSVTQPMETTLTLTGGTPGAPWSADLDNRHLVNREPTYFSRFRTLRWDSLRQHGATFFDIVRRSSPYSGIFAIEFLNTDPDNSSYWDLGSASAMPFAAPSFNFWLNPSAAGQVLDVAGGSIRLEYSAGALTATVDTAVGPVQASVAGVNPDAWHAVAVSVSNDTLVLAVDDQTNLAPMGGAAIRYATVAVDDPWLRLGRGLAGQIAGLRIYDLDSAELLELSTNGGTYDVNGEAEIVARVTPALQTTAIEQTPVTVAVDFSSGAQSRVNVLSVATVRRFGASYISVLGGLSADADTMLTDMPTDDLFPDPRRGAGGLIQRFAAQPASASAATNVLAAIEWTRYDARYAPLHDKISMLQQYFMDSGLNDLNIYAAELLQEAAMSANHGELTWMQAAVTGLTVWGELIELRPDLANIIGQSITNRTDFWTWLRVLSLPARGWLTDAIPMPRPDMTCDLVVPDVNVGTPLAYSATPCRATGAEMADFIDTFMAIDTEIATTPDLFPVYLTTLLTSLEQLPYEFKILFGTQGVTTTSNWELLPVEEAHAALPAVLGYGLRALIIAIKQAIRKGTGGAPANLVAFLQGGTTSRVTRAEMLVTLAYLGARFDDTPDELCSGNCRRLNEQVSDTAKSDMASWFAGIALAKKGEIEEGGIFRRSCAIANNAHGKAFELLVTAAHHMLYDVGRRDNFQILLSDPRKGDDIIKVPIMHERRNRTRHFTNSPFQRKPDLVLAGAEEGQRQWVELKSWKYDSSYLSGTRLKTNTFGLWDGQTKMIVSRTGKKRSLKHTTAAHRQHFLDYAATQTALNEAYWNDRLNVKPNKHSTWIQLWKRGERKWNALVKVGNRYRLEQRETTVEVDEPWMSRETTDNVTTGNVQFRALQRYLSTAPEGMDDNAFETTIGYDIDDHETNYTSPQVTSNYQNADVKPFTVLTFFRLAIQDEARQLWQDMLDQFFGDEFSALQELVDEGGELTEEQIAELRENLTEKALEIVGPWRWLAVNIPLLSDVENAVADWALGEEIESLREFAAEFELPEDYFENACEAP